MSTPVFWRDPALPYVELRKVEDGRSVCYAPHTHTEWSMGAITRGESTFVHGDRQCRVDAGSLVFINPNWVHVCNPIEGRSWAYLMLYVDTQWLADLRCRLDLTQTSKWQDLTPDAMRSPELFDGFIALADALLDRSLSVGEKNDRLLAFLSTLLPQLAASEAPRAASERLCALADYMDAHCAAEVSLDVLSRQADISPGHLIRSFKRHFGMTPHAYVINRRIQRGQCALRQGQSIADAALDSGFSDQPHFQRMFKRLLAATPKQYRLGSVDEQKHAAAGKQGGESAVDGA